MKWFTPTPKTLEELKKQYRTLAMKHHPDCGGTVEAMQQINNEYDSLFEQLKTVHTTSTGDTYTVDTHEASEQFKNIINRLIVLEGISIEIIGSWLWVTGNTYQHKEIIKSLMFRWSNSKRAWYFHGNDYHKTSRKTFSLDEIRDLFGSQTITSKPQLKLVVV